jgi:hypothetical protein
MDTKDMADKLSCEIPKTIPMSEVKLTTMTTAGG